jgi:hypothetical protein
MMRVKSSGRERERERERKREREKLWSMRVKSSGHVMRVGACTETDAAASSGSDDAPDATREHVTQRN